MEELCKRKSLERDFQEEMLDPRIQAELEKLNSTTETINSLEQQLEKARASFRQLLTESTQKKNDLKKKLGSCVDKAAPYYDARIKAKEVRKYVMFMSQAHAETQSAAQRFERACSQLTAAKEMVFLAEQGFFCKGQAFDPAWQEMLNHATMKVNDAEHERLESEVEHKKTAFIFNEAEKNVHQLQKELRRAISKSRPYFEMKASYNQQLEEQKQHVECLEETVRAAKQTYANTLRCLEAISDAVHQQRQEAKMRQEMGTRGSGVGAETPEPPPKHDECAQPVLDTGQGENRKAKDEADSHEWQGQSGEQSMDLSFANKANGKSSHKRSHSKVDNGTSQKEVKVKARDTADEKDVKSPSKNVVHDKARQPNDRKKYLHSSVPEVKVMSSDLASEAELGHSSEMTTRSNAEVMESLQRAKGVVSSRKFLVPRRRSQDDLLDDISDNDSIPGSLASAVLDDEQIQSLMLESSAGEYARFLSRMDSKESEKYKRMSLPVKLSYLERYMDFKPIWDDIQDTSVGTKSSSTNDNSIDCDFEKADIKGTTTSELESNEGSSHEASQPFISQDNCEVTAEPVNIDTEETEEEILV